MTDTPPRSQLPLDLVLVAPRNEAVPTSPYRIEQPLRVQWLARRLEGQPDAGEAVQHAIDLDAKMRVVAERARETELDAPERAEILLQLTRLRVELDALVSRVLPEPPVPSALAALDPEMRVRLADLLGVPMSPEFHALLEMKAAEYIEQGRAFDEVAADFGFAHSDALAELEPRGGLILTHNGSLLQVSAPGAGGDPRARRFVYQNIYGGKMPAEGTLELTKPVRVGHKVRTRHMETSPVRKLHLAVRPDDWQRQRETFRSLSKALAPRVSGASAPPKTLWGAHPNWHPSVVAKSVQVKRGEQQRKRVEQAATSARAELREHLLRLADPAHPADDALLEADVLGLCMFLQRLRTEHGEPGYRLRDVACFVTDRGERCSFEHRGGSSTALLERPARPSTNIEDVGLLEQTLARGAPVALVDGAGSVAAVLGDVVWIQPRQSS